MDLHLSLLNLADQVEWNKTKLNLIKCNNATQKNIIKNKYTKYSTPQISIHKEANAKIHKDLQGRGKDVWQYAKNTVKKPN